MRGEEYEEGAEGDDCRAEVKQIKQRQFFFFLNMNQM